MYQQFFGLTHRPFSATPDPHIVYHSPSVRQSLHSLEQTLRSGEGIGVMTAAAGTGKTLVCKVLGERLANDPLPVLLLNSTYATRSSLLQAILFELGRPYSRMSEQELRLELVACGRKIAQSQTGIALIVDEAHLLGEYILEELRALTNFQMQARPIFRVVLSGQPTLEDILARRSMAALNQRLVCQVTLETLSRQESLEYLISRVESGGGDLLSIFSERALELIVHAADGLPRCLNQLCDHACLLASVEGVRPVQPRHIHEALSDLQKLPLHWNTSLPALDPISELTGQQSFDTPQSVDSPQSSDTMHSFDTVQSFDTAETSIHRAPATTESAPRFRAESVTSEPSRSTTEKSVIEIGTFSPPDRQTTHKNTAVPSNPLEASAVAPAPTAIPAAPAPTTELHAVELNFTAAEAGESRKLQAEIPPAQAETPVPAEFEDLEETPACIDSPCDEFILEAQLADLEEELWAENHDHKRTLAGAAELPSRESAPSDESELLEEVFTPSTIVDSADAMTAEPFDATDRTEHAQEVYDPEDAKFVADTLEQEPVREQPESACETTALSVSESASLDDSAVTAESVETVAAETEFETPAENDSALLEAAEELMTRDATAEEQELIAALKQRFQVRDRYAVLDARRRGQLTAGDRTFNAPFLSRATVGKSAAKSAPAPAVCETEPEYEVARLVLELATELEGVAANRDFDDVPSPEDLLQQAMDSASARDDVVDPAPPGEENASVYDTLYQMWQRKRKQA